MQLFLENPENKNMEVLKMKNPQIEKAMTVLEFISSDKQARELYEAREKELRDKIGQIMFAKEEGFNEGIEKGIEQGQHNEKIKIAHNLLKNGVSVETIVEVTELAPSEVKKLFEKK